MSLTPGMSATEAQLGLEFEVELECALESGVEFGFEVDLPSWTCSSSKVRVRTLESALRMQPKTPPGDTPGGTPGTNSGDRPEAPGGDPEEDHLEELVNYHRAVGDSPRKCRVRHIR